MHDLPVKCDCGKVVARWHGTRLYAWCKVCRKEVEIEIDKEPMSRTE